MDIDGPSNERIGLFIGGWSCIKSMPKKFKDNIVGTACNVKKIGQDDPRRIVHSLKVGMALSLVSLFYYLRPVYKNFGDSAIWAVLTVVVVLEFSVGATLGKCINRGLATLLAGALGVGAQHLATLAGKKGEPIILSFLVFLLAGGATFSRFFPKIKARYDYGVVIFILTFSLVTVSGYRVEEILKLADQRLLTVLIGGLICVIISIVVCPVWAGEDLHKLIALNIAKLADFLEGFGDEYFRNKDDDNEEENTVASNSNKSHLKGYKSVLTSKATEELLANIARWEPFHGRFMFRHPWNQYLKVGALTRKCAYQVEALNFYINSKVPEDFKKRIQDECTNMSSETGMALRKLASGIKTMRQASASNIHVANSKEAAEELKLSLMRIVLPEDMDLSHIMQAATVASLLGEIVSCTEELVESVHELARQAKFKDLDPKVSLDKPSLAQLLHRGTVNPLAGDESPNVIITVCETSPHVIHRSSQHATD
ncbi:hypothetical protein ACHQM5_019834 [Ranunculus cassubicifolius]